LYGDEVEKKRSQVSNVGSKKSGKTGKVSFAANNDEE
jgi:hypothetical protein